MVETCLQNAKGLQALKTYGQYFKCACSLNMCVAVLTDAIGGESLPTLSQVSHMDASSSDGNRNGQKSGAGTANGAFKLGELVTPVSHTLYLSFTLYFCQGSFFCIQPYFSFVLFF